MLWKRTKERNKNWVNRNSVTIIAQPTKRYRLQNLLACYYIDISAMLTATKFLLDTGRFWHHRSLHHDLVYSSGTVVQRAHNAIQQINHHPVESVNKIFCVIHRIDIYSVDGVIQTSNNRGLGYIAPTNSLFPLSGEIFWQDTSYEHQPLTLQNASRLSDAKQKA